jgi:hypothetical protein
LGVNNRQAILNGNQGSGLLFFLLHQGFPFLFVDLSQGKNDGKLVSYFFAHRAALKDKISHYRFKQHNM